MGRLFLRDRWNCSSAWAVPSRICEPRKSSLRSGMGETSRMHACSVIVNTVFHSICAYAAIQFCLISKIILLKHINIIVKLGRTVIALINFPQCFEDILDFFSLCVSFFTSLLFHSHDRISFVHSLSLSLPLPDRPLGYDPVIFTASTSCFTCNLRGTTRSGTCMSSRRISLHCARLASV